MNTQAQDNSIKNKEISMQHVRNKINQLVNRKNSFCGVNETEH